MRVHTTLSSVQTIVGREPEEKLHFSGVVVLAPSAAESRQVQAFNRTEPEIGREAIYRVYFHGPAYRVLDRVESAGANQVIGCMTADLPLDTTDANHGSLVGPAPHRAVLPDRRRVGDRPDRSARPAGRGRSGDRARSVGRAAVRWSRR